MSNKIFFSVMDRNNGFNFTIAEQIGQIEVNIKWDESMKHYELTIRELIGWKNERPEYKMISREYRSHKDFSLLLK